jgi:hypothetical protein
MMIRQCAKKVVEYYFACLHYIPRAQIIRY